MRSAPCKSPSLSPSSPRSAAVLPPATSLTLSGPRIRGLESTRAMPLPALLMLAVTFSPAPLIAATTSPTVMPGATATLADAPERSVIWNDPALTPAPPFRSSSREVASRAGLRSTPRTSEPGRPMASRVSLSISMRKFSVLPWYTAALGSSSNGLSRTAVPEKMK